VISGFCHKVDENCALLGYYTASSGNFSYHYLLSNNPEVYFSVCHIFEQSEIVMYRILSRVQMNTYIKC